ncbi:MAG: hypothetical protein RI883_761 [Bacteroidota bacterium]
MCCNLQRTCNYKSIILIIRRTVFSPFISSQLITVMDWTDKQTWKNCSILTTICLVGCSIGTMGVSMYLINFNWFFVFLISMTEGFLSCMAFIIIWLILFQQMSFISALKNSYNISIVSMLIMMLTENIIILLIAPRLFSNQMNINSDYSFITMTIAILFGFLLCFHIITIMSKDRSNLSLI